MTTTVVAVAHEVAAVPRDGGLLWDWECSCGQRGYGGWPSPAAALRCSGSHKRATARWAKVAGRCPMGCGETLFLAVGGHVTCSYAECPRPDAAADLLEKVS